MKPTALIIGLMVSANASFAGNLTEPVIEPEVIAEDTAATSSGGLLIPIFLVILLAAAASSSGGGGGLGGLD